MKFSIERSKFLEALKNVQNIVPSKVSLPILQNAMLSLEGNRLEMTTTDLDISVKSIVECDGIEDGKTTLPVKLLFNSVGKLAEGKVTVEVDGEDSGKISAGSAKFKLTGKKAADFPKLPENEESYIYSIECQTFKEMLRKTAYAASQDDTRRTLKGVLMSFKDSKLTIVATDGRRLALVEKEMELPKEAEKDVVLPSKAVQELQRIFSGEGSVKIRIKASQICFETEDTEIYSKLIEDVYPNYLQVIPKTCKEKIVVERQLLVDALERASVMTMDEAHSTKLTFEENRLTVASSASEIGYAKDEVPVKYAGEKLEIIFNPAYVMDPLKAIDDDEVKIELNDGHSPAVIRCSIPFLYVLMPLRIS